MASTALDSSSTLGPVREEEPTSGAIKRPLSTSDPEPDLDPEPEAAHAKKRRKQSRPLRLAATPTLQEGKKSSNGVPSSVGPASESEDEELPSHTQQTQHQSQQEDIPLNLSSLPQSVSTSPVSCFEGGEKSEEAKHAARRYIPITPPFILPLQSLPSAAGTTPIRIFNPDAYCELCNKEFCNKYFLKTHKANKHGIYIENSPVSLGGSPYVGSFISTDISVNTISDVSSETATPLPTTIELGDAKPGVNGTGRAFCDICQKKFCNKYFVRRHKAKIHGILDYSTTSPGYHSFPGDHIPKIELDETYRASETGSFPIDGAYGNVVENTLEQEDTRPCTSDKTDSNSLKSLKMSPSHSVSDEVVENTNTKEEHDSNVERNVEQPFSTPSQESKDTVFSTDHLRKLGVINADAFCEICCKEYCNKYFLRTHKLKRHGILVPDGDNRPSIVSANTALCSTSQQNSPLNLIIGEQSANNYNSSIEDSECEVCGRRFQSSYLLQMHRTYLHVVDKTSGNNNNGGSDSISEDLQKLQTMILQLNNLNVSKITVCSICNKDVEGGSSLQDHMVTEHGVKLEESDSSPSPLNDPHAFYCFICKKDFLTKYLLNHHMEEYHSSKSQVIVPQTNTSLPLPDTSHGDQQNIEKCPSMSTSLPVQQGSSDKKVSATPTSSYCEICNKELCNKYFMKTHMQRMHGIEIENGAQIGGVICDICNKELCSKYFLRVHKQNTHGIVEDCPREGTAISTPAVPATENDPALKPCELGDLSNRYFSHFTEVCPLCSRRFRSIKWLKAHLFNDHGRLGTDKWKELEAQSQQIKQPWKETPVLEGASSHSPTLKIPTSWSNRDVDNGSQPTQDTEENSPETASQQVFPNLFGVGNSSVKNYHCSYCSFSTPVLAFLFVHERSHAGLSSQTIPVTSKPLKCPICFQSFLHSDMFQHHILTHQFSNILNPFLEPNNQSTYTSSLPKTLQTFPRNVIHSEEGEKDSDATNDAFSVAEEDSSMGGTTKSKFRCSQCSLKFKSREILLSHVQSKHSTSICSASTSSDASKMRSSPHGLYKCAQCGFSAVHMILLKKHIRKEHEDESSRSEKGTELQEVKKKLQDAARKSQVPASYAVPQSLGRFVMQPFLLEEPGALAVAARDANFVPSLVFLPVREKLSAPLTVAFTLTPA